MLNAYVCLLAMEACLAIWLMFILVINLEVLQGGHTLCQHLSI